MNDITRDSLVQSAVYQNACFGREQTSSFGIMHLLLGSRALVVCALDDITRDSLVRSAVYQKACSGREQTSSFGIVHLLLGNRALVMCTQYQVTRTYCQESRKTGTAKHTGTSTYARCLDKHHNRVTNLTSPLQEYT